MTIGDKTQVLSHELGYMTGTVIAVNMEHRNYTVAMELPKGIVRESFWICDGADIVKEQPVRDSKIIAAPAWCDGMTKEQKAEAQERLTREAVRLRRTGMSIEKIGNTLGVGSTTICKWLDREKRRKK